MSAYCTYLSTNNESRRGKRFHEIMYLVYRVYVLYGVAETGAD